MALRDILKDGDPVLRMKSRPVSEFDMRLHKLLDDMHETMIAADGCGLAAPQVGILRRAVVIEVERNYVEMINPVILKEEGEQIGSEGCLSVPGRSGVVKRPYKVTVKFWDRHGAPHIRVYEDYFAVACCHEIDHLDGILYYDKLVEPGRREM